MGSSPRPAAHPGPTGPPAAAAATDAERSGRTRPSGAGGPHHEVDPAPEPGRPQDAVARPVEAAPRDVGSTTADDPRVTAGAPAGPSRARRPAPQIAASFAAPFAAPVEPATEPVAVPLATPLAAPPEASIVELAARALWPSLPGAVGHPSFPALLTAVLLGVVGLACRGDRRDPKLAAAAIDARDARTTFG